MDFTQNYISIFLQYAMSQETKKKQFMKTHKYINTAQTKQLHFTISCSILTKETYGKNLW